MRLQLKQLRKLIREEIEKSGYNKTMENKITTKNVNWNQLFRICQSAAKSFYGERDAKDANFTVETYVGPELDPGNFPGVPEDNWLYASNGDIIRIFYNDKESFQNITLSYNSEEDIWE